MFIEIRDILKSYGGGENRTRVLNNVSAEMGKGELCAILGPSGSGKSTLLNVIGGLDSVEGGHIYVDGLDIANMKPAELSLYRRKYLGFIFQFYNLIPNLTVRENIQVCEYLTKTPLNIDELVETTGLSEHYNKLPSQLSGGQQQRCAIARALVKNPLLLLCDEPTGALDSKSAAEIMVLLEKVNRIYGTTILIVTHNTVIKAMSNRIIKIKDGQIYKNYINEAPVSASALEW